MIGYVDTNVLLELFARPINDRVGEGSGKVSATSAVALATECHVSTLCLLEFESVLARRVRARAMKQKAATMVKNALRGDVAQGRFFLHEDLNAALPIARDLVARVSPSQRLDTLDALHLAVAINAGCDTLLSGDDVLLRAAGVVGLRGLAVAMA